MHFWNHHEGKEQEDHCQSLGNPRMPFQIALKTFSLKETTLLGGNCSLTLLYTFIA